ncbi:MAG: hypothetical protein WC197_04590 [Candidatus Gastranaerophilaceae bacterium]|jgi:hypothetical protein
MREIELNTIFDLIPDPDKNYVNIQNRKIRSEVERITRIFSLIKKQNEMFVGEALVNYAQFDLLACEN